MIKARINTGVLRRVRSFLHPFRAAAGPPDRSSDEARINLPPLTGRRDAAFDHAVNLIGINIFALDEQERLSVYNQIIALLEESVFTTHTICNHQDERRGGSEKDLLEYLMLLHDNLQAAAALLNHQISLHQANCDSSFIGRELQSSLRGADEVMAESELNLFQCVCKLAELSVPKVRKYREYCHRIFSPPNMNRYRRALEEYRRVFAQKYPLPSPPPEDKDQADAEGSGPKRKD